MSADYGVFSEIVAIAGSLVAASSAIGLAWMRRAKWLPPTETLTGATAKTSALICAVMIAVIWVFRHDFGSKSLGAIAVMLLPMLLIALGVSIYVNTAYSFTRRKPLSRNSVSEDRILGGFRLTQEAAEISRKRKLGPQALYENSNYKADLVWTRGSQAALQVASTFGFIFLQVSGSLALATVALLIALVTGQPPSTA